MSVGEPQEATDSEETPEGPIVRYDRHEHIIGVSIVNAKWILDHDQAVALTLPNHPAAADPERQVQIEPSTLLAEIIHPMAKLPKEWQVTDDDQRAQNWAATSFATSVSGSAAGAPRYAPSSFKTNNCSRVESTNTRRMAALDLPPRRYPALADEYRRAGTLALPRHA